MGGPTGVWWFYEGDGTNLAFAVVAVIAAAVLLATRRVNAARRYVAAGVLVGLTAVRYAFEYIYPWFEFPLADWTGTDWDTVSIGAYVVFNGVHAAGLVILAFCAVRQGAGR